MWWLWALLQGALIGSVVAVAVLVIQRARQRRSFAARMAELQRNADALTEAIWAPSPKPSGRPTSRTCGGPARTWGICSGSWRRCGRDGGGCGRSGGDETHPL
jgi:hypothetical protein